MRQSFSSVAPRILSVAGSSSVIFFLLSLAIVGPLWQPGHLLTVDSPIALNQEFLGYFWGFIDGPERGFAAGLSHGS